MNFTEKIKLIHQRGLFFINMRKSQRGLRIRPVIANLFITTRCNAQCSYCYTDKTISEDMELNTEQWLEVIDGLYRQGCRMFNLMGGEPLLRKDFAVILNHILQKNAICDINTNGFLVSKYIDILCAASQIFTSLDGDEVAHDRNRGKGTYQKTIKGIQAARLAGVPVRLNCTVTKNNTDQIDFLIEFCEQNNLFLTFTPLLRIRDTLESAAGNIYLDDKTARRTFKRIKEAKRKSKRIMNSDASLDYFINYPVALNRIVRRKDPDNLTGYYKKRCPYGRLQFFIISNGDVFPCHNMWNEPSFTPKNILTEGMEKALKNANDLWCKYCWLANLVEWNEFSSLKWLTKGCYMTFKQICQL